MRFLGSFLKHYNTNILLQEFSKICFTDFYFIGMSTLDSELPAMQKLNNCHLDVYCSYILVKGLIIQAVRTTLLV